MENDERVWLKHEGTGHLWECPKGAVEGQALNGWYPTDERPVPVDPTLAERPAEWWDPIPGPEKPKSKRASAVSTEESDSVG